MKNKTGFTLIELLAVIIILAIIALIATPIVINTIENSKKRSAEISALNYIRAVEISVSTSEVKKDYISDGEYTIDSDGNLIGDDLPNGKLEIDAKGDKPTSGTIIIKSGEVQNSSTMVIGDYIVLYSDGKCTATKIDNTTSEIYENGEIVYFNVDTGTSCTDYTSSQSNTGVKSGCMKFHAFNDDGGDTVNLILDHNTTAKIKWVSKTDYIAAGGTESDYGDYGKNDKGPLTLLTQLKTDTESWQGTVTPTNYTMDQSTQTSGANYTIDYSDYKARLITANEIATITGNTSWDEKVAAESDRYYFHDNTQTEYKGAAGTNKYAWLFDNISGCTTYGCNVEDSSTWAYWTASSNTSSSYLAWDVNGNGTLHNNLVGTEFVYGVRPVIEVSKDKLA